MSNFDIKIKGGSLCFYGNWFGRPFDNFHTIETATLDHNKLTITFMNKEVLTVFNPEEIINEVKELRIEKAAKVIWSFYAYGSNNLNKRQIKYLSVNDLEVIEDKDGKKRSLKRENISAVICV